VAGGVDGSPARQGSASTGSGGRLGGSYGAAQTALLLAFTAAYVFSAAPQAPHDASVAAAGRIAGGVLCTAGLALLTASFANLGRAVQVDPEPREGSRLVTRGVYARLRHPMYTAIVILVLGLFLRKPALAVGAMTLAVIAFLALKVRVEERLLLARYADYAAYRARTRGMFLLPPRDRRAPPIGGAR
jgi:protein-S-isoprenylcysteine O-methyltransferase Ste14